MPPIRSSPEQLSEQSPSEPASGATRDLLANERTLLAWVRTAVAIMGLGFVVARFGLLIREIGGIGGTTPRGVSTTFRVALSPCGTLLLVLAYVQYRRVADDILHARVRWYPWLGVLLTSLLALAGILLALYLLLTSRRLAPTGRRMPPWLSRPVPVSAPYPKCNVAHIPGKPLMLHVYLVTYTLPVSARWPRLHRLAPRRS